MDNTSPASLQQVWQLYDLQNEFILALGKRSWTRKFKEQVREKVGIMARLLSKVREHSYGYIGGEDVLQAIEEIQGDVKRRIDDL
ncbi:hypothetical protein HYZ98_04065 [Candidatus Peregrinibacteria bacterium]|nr:hypothetical protein [Candidatus Peregrinibacteria bacterium]